MDWTEIIEIYFRSQAIVLPVLHVALSLGFHFAFGCSNSLEDTILVFLLKQFLLELLESWRVMLK